MGLFEERLESAREYQQHFYETSCDWNVFTRSDPTFLRNYVGVSIYGDPQDIEGVKYIYDKKQEDVIEKLLSQIMEHSDQTELIYCIALHCVTFETESRLKKLQSKEDQKKESQKKDEKTLKKETKSEDEVEEKTETEENENPTISVTTIFKIRKEKEKISEYYAWFIDWEGRVYQSWDDFLNNNNLHRCTMVVPKDGEYQPDPDQEYSETMTHVWIEYRQSPACGKVLLNVIDVGSNVLQIASMGVGIASCFTPIAPVALTVGMGVAVATSAYSTGRTISDIADRATHKESMIDRKAIGHYVSIGGNVLGAASMGASKYITSAALKGEEIGRAALIAHDCVTVGSVAFKGTEIVHRIYGMVRGDEEVTVASCIGLVADIFFFTNVVIDVKTAKALIKQNQTVLIENHKKSLVKKRHRKSFNKMAKNAKDTNEIVRKIKQIKTPEEMSKLASASTSKPGKPVTMSGPRVSSLDKVVNEININWPAYAKAIIQTIMEFVPKVVEMVQNGELDTKGKWTSLIVEFLWILARPVIREMTRTNDFVKTLHQFYERNMDKMVDDFREFLKTKLDDPFEEKEQFTYPSKIQKNTTIPKNHHSLIRDFAKSNELVLTSDAVSEIKKLFEEVETNLPEESENLISALMQMSLFVLNSVNIADVKSHYRALPLAISFLWDKFQEIMMTNSIIVADEIVLKMFDNSEDKLTEMVQNFETYLLANL